MGIWEKMQDFLGAMAQQRHLVALRDGMIAVVPIILVGSTFLLLGSQSDVIVKFFPSVAKSAFGVWYQNNFATILLPYRFTMGMLSLYVAFTIAASLAGQYRLPVLPQGLGGVMAFLITIQIFKVPLEVGASPVWVLPLKPLGGEGLFLAILCGIATVELSRVVNYLVLMGIMKEKPSPSKADADNRDSGGAGAAKEEGEGGTVEDRGDAGAAGKAKDAGNAEEEKAECEAPLFAPQTDTGERIPRAVTEAFASFLPLLSVVSLIWVICHSLHIDIYNGLTNIMKPLERLGDTLPCVVVVNFLLHLLGVAGLHGISVINSVFFALWQKFLLVNTDAHAAGKTLIHVTAYPFYQWFVWIGGAGTTLPVPFLLLFFKSPHMKRIGKISLVPVLFNVNEPVLFGLPVVANPLLAIPFIVVPMITGSVAFLAISSGLVTRPFIEVPWVLPAFLGAPLCDQDIRALLLLLVNVLISAVIWFPFLKAYEKKLKN